MPERQFRRPYCGERRDDSVMVDSPDALPVLTDEQISRVIVGDTVGSIHASRRRRTAVAACLPVAVTLVAAGLAASGDGGDDAAVPVDAAHAVVVRVGDDEVACGVASDVPRLADVSRERRS